MLFVRLEIILYFYYGILKVLETRPSFRCARIYDECEMLCPVLRIWRQDPLLPALCRLPVGPFTTYSKCDASSKELAVFVQSCSGI